TARPARSERRRKDHAHAGTARAGAARCRHGDAARAFTRASRRRRARGSRWSRRGAGLLSVSVWTEESDAAGAAGRRRRIAGWAADRRRARAARPLGTGGRAGLGLLRGYASAARARRRPAAIAAAALSRRADERARSSGRARRA